MVILGVILMFVGGFIFAIGEKNEGCLGMIIGAIINFIGIGLIIAGW